MGLSDLKKDDDETMYAGGEKSGMALEGAGNPQQSLINQILEQAQRGAKDRGSSFGDGDEDDSEKTLKIFQGQPRKLNDEASPSSSGTTSKPGKKQEKVKRTLTFWRDGFTVADSGPIFEYQRPENQRLLSLIQSGHAPLDLLDVEPGQAVELNISHKLSEDFKPSSSAASTVSFSGKGYKLSDVDNSSPNSNKSKSNDSTKKQLDSAPSVDSSKPTTSLQLRFADGTRANTTFNNSTTIAAVFAFIQNRSDRSFNLLSGVPPTKLEATDTRTLEEAGLLHTVIIQQWK